MRDSICEEPKSSSSVQAVKETIPGEATSLVLLSARVPPLGHKGDRRVFNREFTLDKNDDHRGNSPTVRPIRLTSVLETKILRFSFMC